ncbi:MAG: hypothetical protein ACK47B_09150 [Armatimonadota bacterium]
MISQDTVVTTDDARVTSLAIEVKVVRIGTRQMTKAVFRQLGFESVIDQNTGELCGIPWGRINEHLDCELEREQGKPHLHVIWQKGTELRRAVVTASIRRAEVDVRFERAVNAWVLVASRCDGWKPDGEKRGNFHLNAAGVRAFVAATPLLQAIWDDRQSFYLGGNRSVEEEFRSALASFDYDYIPSIEDCSASLEEWADVIKSRDQAYREAYAQLQSLDQLFIAV